MLSVRRLVLTRRCFMTCRVLYYVTVYDCAYR
jgi:hypothetical protein